MKNDLIILRYESGTAGTFGVAIHECTWLCHTLEPGQRDGRSGHAVKAGRYPLTLEWSPKFGRALPTIIAPGRSGLRFHQGNYVRDTSGCVLVGTARGERWLDYSSAALGSLLKYITTHNITHVTFIDYEMVS